MQSPLPPLPAHSIARKRGSSVGLVLALVGGTALMTGCPKPIDPKASVKEKRLAAEKKRAARGEKRPPFPNMATAAWGKTVLEREAKAADPGLSGRGRDAAFAAAKSALHSRDDGSEAMLVAASAALWRSAMDDGDRSLAASLMGVGLSLNPSVLNYKDRLTDAAGLAAYSASLRGGTVVAQSAQALIAIAIGRVHAGKQILDSLSANPELTQKLDGEASLLLANARYLRGQRDDAFFRDVTVAIRENPLSMRARALKASALLDLGYGARAADVATATDGTPPYLEAISIYGRGQAGVIDNAVERLKIVQTKVREPERGEVLYWLGRLLAATPGKESEAQAIAVDLDKRPGFVGEASVIRAVIALRAGEGKKAFDFANKIASRTGSSPAVALDALWLLVDACALNGDVDCVQRRGTNAIGADGNRARWAHAMAALALIGKVDPKTVTPPLDVDGMLRLAHRLSPFDPDLAKRVGDDVSNGGDAMATRIRAARRAMVADARGLAAESLTKEVADDCRVCRAILAVANPNTAAGARGAVLAIKGKGPPLAEDDLVAVIDAMGAVPTEGANDILFALSKDPRKSVKEAVARAKADLEDPSARKAREEKAKKHAGHGHDEATDGHKPTAPGSVPVPH